jgi:Zn-dependent M16 (insulinase) family peptidase
MQKVDTFMIETSVLPPRQKNHSELLAKLPFTTVLHDSHDTHFIRAYFLFDLKNVPVSLRKYLMIFDDLLTASPAYIDGNLLTDKQVADLMTKELMDNSAGPGYLSYYSHFFHFYVEVPINEFNLVPKWAKALLRETVFEKDKIIAILKNMASMASASKREGYRMTELLFKSLSTVKGFFINTYLFFCLFQSMKVAFMMMWFWNNGIVIWQSNWKERREMKLLNG